MKEKRGMAPPTFRSRKDRDRPMDRYFEDEKKKRKGGKRENTGNVTNYGVGEEANRTSEKVEG